MSALPVQTIFDALREAGLNVSLAPDGGLAVAPASRLTQELRDLIRGNKAVLVDRLLEAQELTARLIAAAMCRCDEFGDSPAARAEMRDDCLATPVHLKADLLAHFQETAKPTQEGRADLSKAPAESKGAGPAQLADPNAWRELAQAYHAHHFQCGVCKAAGRGAGYGPRCGVGASLWTNYQGTP
ncbi:MAG: hypothetical protein ACYCZ6_06340 [Polaromonas sp.]